VSYQLTTPAQARWSKHNKYTSKSTKAYLQDNSNYLYIINAPNGIELIKLEDEYPISSHMIPVITELIMSKELKVLASTPTDVTNDTKEDAGGQA